MLELGLERERSTHVTLDGALKLVMDTIHEVAAEDELARPELRPDTNILNDTELDSMALALVVVKLEEKTGKDPFAEEFIHFRTVEELAALYVG